MVIRGPDSVMEEGTDGVMEEGTDSLMEEGTTNGAGHYVPSTHVCKAPP
jgi:hypothetical protein